MVFASQVDDVLPTPPSLRSVSAAFQAFPSGSQWQYCPPPFPLPVYIHRLPFRGSSLESHCLSSRLARRSSTVVAPPSGRSYQRAITFLSVSFPRRLFSACGLPPPFYHFSCSATFSSLSCPVNHPAPLFPFLALISLSNTFFSSPPFPATVFFSLFAQHLFPPFDQKQAQLFGDNVLS